MSVRQGVSAIVSLSAVALLMGLALVAAAAPWLLPDQGGTARRVAAAVIFVASYLALAIGKVPACRSTAPASRWSAPA